MPLRRSPRVLAQPAFALAVAQWRGRAIAGTPVDLRALAREAGWLALLWGAAFALTHRGGQPGRCRRCSEGGSLLAALGLSLVAGVVLLGLWRVWPLWHGLENEGGTLPRHWRELGELEPGAWRGLGVAAIMAAILAAIVLLAWPGLLGSGARWTLATLLLLASPPLHWLLQRVAPADSLPELDVADDVDARQRRRRPAARCAAGNRALQPPRVRAASNRPCS